MIGAETSGRHHFLETTGSTNDYVAALDGSLANSALAARQTGGRGRHGRIWRSADGDALLGSVRYFVAANSPRLHGVFGAGHRRRHPARAIGGPKNGDYPGQLSTLEENISIKWPNDLVAVQPNGKLGGILCELAPSRLADEFGNSLGCLIVGLGVNIFSAPPADEFSKLKPIALTQAFPFLNNQTLSVKDLWLAVVAELDRHFLALSSGAVDGSLSKQELENGWKRAQAAGRGLTLENFYLLNKKIKVGGAVYTVRSLDSGGALTVADSSGAILSIEDTDFSLA